MATITIPPSMLPEDGRFGSGPSKIRPEQVQALDAGATTVLGTSHRQSTIKQIVGSIRAGLAEFLRIPDDYEIVLGNGGATAFWDMACASLITRRAAFGVYGSFSAKFADSAASAPFLEDPVVYRCEPGDCRLPEYTEYVDAYCWAHNETSTGVAAPVHRIAGSLEQGALTIVDATSAAGALPVDISQTDAYYFSPQKAFGSDGGLWIAALSPAAIDRAYGIAQSTSLEGVLRWIPPFLSLKSAIENSRKDQTLNTPAIATLIMLNEQLQWLNNNGGMAWATARCAKNASLLYQWAEQSDYAHPFVADPALRSNAVVTIDLDDRINAKQVTAALRENGILDTSGYRKLGRNQLRVGVFPSVEPADVAALTNCVDYVVGQLWE
ncbi:phosphoserine aminotransferase [Bifidobacterium pullorum subsp. gallinarum]|uniref:phosphoserine transaminase n=2 Tax=Bifidobacterium pullorum TaxID=78448 RepID=A0A087ANH9_9BIFI|nr:phosphoserine transaminase [Bifidobacterium pullorum]KFI60329.1 phosphoserine aminotransferase [Bifidobacterium pullorum subsp. gallinarum]KFI80934.1 phosphoserine aminotransferase [Bifidobacterium pullorum]